MEVHSDPTAAEGDAFHAQPQALLPTVVTRQCDLATGCHYAMPRESDLPVQRSYGQARSARESRGGGDLTVRDHFPSRDSRDHPSQWGQRGHVFSLQGHPPGR
jgi:hypothetical protein